jgi:3-deoxy-manno-octulosonate cytidylyltransferase (CMP-KDO synthetase)
MKYLIIIPARLSSTRLPEKPLVDILGKSMIRRTYEKCLEAVDDPAKVIVATDHERIYQHAEEFDMNVIMTSNNCLTGTDRVAEVATKVEADYYINVQGDEPIINPDDIKKTIDALPEKGDTILNGYTLIDQESDYNSLTIPKVVFREDERLLYMSRAPIPGSKHGKFQESYRQVCIYAFPKEALKKFALSGVKTRFEEMEDIEILRFLEMGYEVQMLRMSSNSIAVDTPSDLERVRKVIKERIQ